MKNRKLSIVISLLITALLFGCGGGGGGGGGTASSSSSGVISDPYVVNAMFDEWADGNLVQSTTAPSTMTGDFEFPAALTVGNTIKMRSTVGVMHATPGGAVTPYEGQVLSRRVSQALVDAVAGGGEVIVTPLTTLADQLQAAAEDDGETLTEDEAIEAIVTMIGDAGVTADDLFDDPMEAFETGGDNDPALLRASMAVNIALGAGAEVEGEGGFDAVLDAAQALIDAIIPSEPDADGVFPEMDESNFVAANVIVEVVAGADDPADAIGAFDEDEISDIVDAAADLEDGEVLVVDADGGNATTNYQATFDTKFAIAINSFATAFASDDAEDLLDVATQLTQARVTYDLAASSNAAVTITANDKDVLNFFYAFSRVALLANMDSVGDADSLESLGDILDQLNITAHGDGVDRYNLDEDAFEDLNVSAQLTTAKLKQFIYQQLGTALGDAIAALDAVTTAFEYEVDGTSFDYSDALFVKAAANGVLFQASLLQGINLEVETDGVTLSDILENDDLEPNELLDNPEFLKVNDASALAASKVYGIAAANGMKAAITAMLAETDVDQDDDFINFYSDDAIEMAADIAEAREDLDKGLEVFAGATLFSDEEDGDITVDLTQFFAGAVELRALLPDLTGEYPGVFPDATLAGMVSGDFDLNADEFADGIPDILQDELLGFADTMLFGRAFEIQFTDVNHEWQQIIIAFADSGNTFSDLLGNDLGTWAINATAGLELSWEMEDGTVDVDVLAWGEGWLEDGWLEFEPTMSGVPYVMLHELREELDLNKLLTSNWWPRSVFIPLDSAMIVNLGGSDVEINNITVDFSIDENTGEKTYVAYLRTGDETTPPEMTDSGIWHLDLDNNPGWLVLDPEFSDVNIKCVIDPVYVTEWNDVRAMTAEVSIYDGGGIEIGSAASQVIFWQ